MDSNTYHLNKYLDELDRASTVSDYLDDNYYTIVEDLKDKYNLANFIMNDTELEVWYIDFESDCHEILHEMESYVEDQGYASTKWDLIEELKSLTH